MTDRKEIIEGLLRNIHVMKHKLMVGYTSKKSLLITPSQGFVLRFVAENKLSNTKAIAQTLHISSSAATQLIDGLVEKGYLTRTASADDRRVMSLSLSKKAKTLFKKFKEHGLEKMTGLFSALTDKELAQYAALSKKITDSILNKKF